MEYFFRDDNGGKGSVTIDLAANRWALNGAGWITEANPGKPGTLRKREIKSNAGSILQTWWDSQGRLTFFGYTDTFRPGSTQFKDTVQGQLVPDTETGILSQGFISIYFGTPRTVDISGKIDYGFSGAEDGGANAQGNG